MTPAPDRKVLNVERKAIADIKHLASVTRGLSALADELGEANDLSALFAERKAGVDALAGQERDLTSRIASLAGELQARLDDADAQAKKIVATAETELAAAAYSREQADRTLADARSEAKQIIEDAKARARDAVATEVDAIKRKLG